MNRVLVVSVGHLKRALSIFGHGPGIHLNTSELCETVSLDFRSGLVFIL